MKIEVITMNAIASSYILALMLIFWLFGGGDKRWVNIFE